MKKYASDMVTTFCNAFHWIQFQAEGTAKSKEMWKLKKKLIALTIEVILLLSLLIARALLSGSLFTRVSSLLRQDG